MRTIEIGRVSAKFYPDHTTGYDGYVVTPIGSLIVDDKHRVAWEAKLAVVRLLHRGTRTHAATLTAPRGNRATSLKGVIKYADEAIHSTPLDVELRARNNGSFAVMAQAIAKIEATARL